MSQKNTNTYDFLINEDDEVMLLLYEKESSVENPQISIDPLKSCAVLRRNDLDGVEITDISEDILDIILEQETLLVCELSAEDNEEDTKITNAYEATVFIQ
jgi:hypothetical protein